ncbi:MAG TPA: hypothetical protein VFD58_18455 [Blastocatellia bacterium]|nr:hypothetical protein [Blastocatellia bacterium]
MTSRKLTHVFLVPTALMMLSISTLAADPGTPFPASGIVSDQKAGSVLIYNFYSSSSINPAAENTRLNITNTNPTTSVFIHLFFIDGRTCSAADSFLCLSRSQTTSLLASDIDPDVMGFLVAIAINGDSLPINFNYLIGDEYIRLTGGHLANLGAEAISAIDLSTLSVTAEATTTVNFDNVQYNALPRTLAVDSLASVRDGNDTILVINRIGGSMLSSVASIGGVFGIMFDDQEIGRSYSFSSGSCQFKSSYSDSFPRTIPRFSSVIPAGGTGWTKFWATSDNALLGAVINRSNSGGAASFTGGHNLHKLTYTTAGSFEIPVFTASCN